MDCFFLAASCRCNNRGLPSAAPPQPKFSPRNTRMNANRKEVCSIWRRFLECDSPRRVALDRSGRCRKAVRGRWDTLACLANSRLPGYPTGRGRPALTELLRSQSTACETLFRFASISVIRGQKILCKVRSEDLTSELQ